MSESNGVIRIGRKGRKTFAIGEKGKPFTIDIVEVYQQWIIIDENFRPMVKDEEGNRPIPTTEMPQFHASAIQFVKGVAGDTLDPEDGEMTITEAFDFIARLRELYLEMLDFFQPKSPKEQNLPDSSVAALRFSVEEETQS